MNISIIISTHNRSHLLRRTLESFGKLETEGLTWEVLIVDNASDDQGETEKLLKEFEPKLPLTVLSEPVPGKNRALNKAIPLARGELFVFTDNDIIADPMWIKNLWEASKRWPEADIFGGRIEPLFPETVPDWVKNIKKNFYVMSFAPFHPVEQESIITQEPFGPNLTIRSSIFQTYSYAESIGPSGKQYPMGSETNLIARLFREGYECVYVPSASIQHIIEQFQLSYKWLSVRAFNFGWGRFRANPQDYTRTLFGVPLFLWRKMAVLWIKYYLAFVFFPKEKIQIGLQYHYLRGLAHGTKERFLSPKNNND